MRPFPYKAASVLILMLGGVLAALPIDKLRAHGIPPAGFGSGEISAPGGPRDLQLEVFVNGVSTELIASFRQESDGRLAIEPDQLRNVGLLPVDEATLPDGRIDVSRLPGVAVRYDEAGQSVHFSVIHDALAARIIDAHEGVDDSAVPEARSTFGGLLNYTLFASSGGDEVEDLWSYEGASAWLEGRVFSPFGTISSGHIARASPSALSESVRLDTTWSYSAQRTMITYSAGDVITGGLSWTRPVRLGGIQIRRNFGLRPDLVTMPLPDISGSAAVPSTVDVYVNNTRRLSREVPAGPFQVTNLPVVTGSGMAHVVVRDALGRETAIESPFFASSKLLAPGLWDFSAEAGFARRFYGIESNDYDERLMAAGTVRYGLSERLTLESHFEGGGGLISGGAGAAFGLGPHGVGTVAGSASSFEGRTGFLLAGSVELAFRDVHFHARTQRTFGDYMDIAAVTADPRARSLPDYPFINAAPLRALDQVSLSVPLKFDPSTLGVSYTHTETIEGDRSQLLGFSFDRRLGKRASLYATAFTDLNRKDSFGVFAGLSIALGRDMHASTGVSSDSRGTVVTTDLIKSEKAEIGSVGWRLRDVEGAYTNRAASVSYRAPFARFEAGVEQYDERFRATGQMDGAIVFAGNDLFLSNRINDAFAVVDTGASGVEVQYENRPAGRTNGRGKLLVPSLRSYEPNEITIDPTNLPVDATVNSTREVAVPAGRSGTIVKFNVDKEVQAALVTLRDEEGEFLEPGATGVLEGSAESFVVGYDGQAFITGLGRRNRVAIDQPTRGRCVAEFSFQPRPGEQVSVPDAVCRQIR